MLHGLATLPNLTSSSTTLPFAMMVSLLFLNKPSTVLTQGLVTCYILKLKHSFLKYSMISHVKLTIYNSTQPLIIAPSSKIATSYFLAKKVREQTTERKSIPSCENSKCKTRRQELKEEQGSQSGWRHAGGRHSGKWRLCWR